MARTITSANLVFTIRIPGVFDQPVTIQGASTDDFVSNDAFAATESKPGVDGGLAHGYVYNPFKLKVKLQANSPSVDVFDAWFAAQQQAREAFPCEVTILLPAVGKRYTMTNGGLGNYKPLADAKKTLEPQEFDITFQRVDASNV